MIYTPAVKTALKLCFEAHAKQYDKCGIPYVSHPLHLAEQMATEDEICAALLHDTIEDSGMTADDLRSAGIPERAIEAVTLLTHEDGVPYFDYVKKLASNDVARKVKIADLRHNSQLARLDEVRERDLERLRKYQDARVILGDMAYSLETPCGSLSVQVNGGPHPFHLEDESRCAYTVSPQGIGRPDKTFRIEIDTLPLTVGDQVSIVFDFGSNVIDWGSDEYICHWTWAKDGYSIGVGFTDDESAISGGGRCSYCFNNGTRSYTIAENPSDHRFYDFAHYINLRVAWRAGVSEADAHIVGWAAGY